MNYELINQVYEEIINIVNDYIRRKNCSYEVAKKLSFTLLGYYLVMGPEIFSKINTVLDCLTIYECLDKEEYQNTLNNIKGRTVKSEFNPILTWDYRFDDENKFLGAIPYILYLKGGDFENVLSLAHELSHSLEATGASVENESQEDIYISQGFGLIKVEKESGRFEIEIPGFSELVASSVETKIAQSLTSLDANQLTNPLLKEFINSISKYKNKNVLAWSYEILSMTFKDLMDNTAFFNLIKKYFYDNNEIAFKEEYHSYAEGLRYSILKYAAENLENVPKTISDILFYTSSIERQSMLFSQATHFAPDKRLLIIV